MEWSELVHSPKKLPLGSRNGCRETDTSPEAQYIVLSDISSCSNDDEHVKEEDVSLVHRLKVSMAL